MAAGKPRERSLRDIRPLEMLRPGTVQLEDICMHRLQRRQLVVGNILVNEDYKIDIAVDIEVANRERALQICADEIITKNIANPSNEIT